MSTVSMSVISSKGRMPDDDQIVDQIRSGNYKMLTLLQKRNISTIRSYILRNNGDSNDVDDVVQEAVIAVWQKVQDPGFTLTAKLDTFVFAIAKNTWLKTLRKQGRVSVQDFSEGPYQHVADTAEQYEDDKQALIATYMARLGDTCRELLSLFYYEQWDMEKIAHKMRFANAQTAKAKKYQCKKKLESLIRANYSAEDLL